ncbi:MAG: hypothetical protein SF097_04345 [Acidobacteriota bacterium]|nr:hypothetical protein [Acidobacteriota bacterium]
MSSSKLEHLKMLQAVITRMASNSFMVKGWCITLVSALLALSAKDARFMVFVAYLPVLLFWWLDAFFLHQERLFRELYDHVRTSEKDESDFSMKTLGKDSQVVSQRKVAWSKTLRWFYGWLFIAVSAAVYVVMRLLPPK